MGERALEKVREETLSAKELAFMIARAAEEKKALDTKLIDVRSVTDTADYLIVTGGESSAQLKAISSEIEDTLSKNGIEPAHKEGKYGDKWFLFDYGDVTVHIIEKEARNFYRLEEFWSHAMEVARDEWEEA